MSFYELIYILTNIIYVLTINKLFTIFFYKESCNLKVKNLVCFLYLITLGVIIFITRIPIIMLFVNILFLFLISLSYKSSFQKKIFSISFIYSIVLIIELISSASFGFFELSGLKDSTFNSVYILIFTRIISLVIVYLISKYKNSLKSEYNIPKIYYLAFFIILFGTLYLFVFGLDNQNITMKHIIISGSVLILVNITMIFIDEKIYKSIIIENEKSILKQQNEALQNQMEIINQSSENIRLLKHDFKNHILMLENLYKGDKSDEINIYINNLLGSIEKETFSNTNNFVIDSILNFKMRSIKNSDIKLSMDINVPITINILAHDLTTILANLLDNAITACENSKDKILNIKINSKMNNLIILINNSYDGKIICENGKFKTTKIYKSGHGLGLTSVKKILEKYDGEMRINYTSDTFSTSVIIPY